jgi:hypothetical protein
MDVFHLASDHVWKAAPGCRILVLDHGGLRLDIPCEWIVYPRSRHVFAIDRFPPDDQMLLAISCRRVAPEVTGIPLLSILEEWVKCEDRVVQETGPPISIRRWPMEALWLQVHVTDPDSGRQRWTRLCAARADLTQAFFAFEFDPGQKASCDPVWTTLIETLVIGDYILDPATGRRRMTRG